MTLAPSVRRWTQLAGLAALLLAGCAEGDPEFAEKAVRSMLGNGANAPSPSDLPKVGDSDWCFRVNLVLDNAKLSPAIKNQYLEVGRARHCQRALAAQPAAQ